MRQNILVKLGVVLIAVVLLPWMFIRSIRDTIAEPYQVNSSTLSGWSLVLTDSDASSVSVLGLRPPQLLVPDLFDQLFNRTMESMFSPGEGTLPIVLRHEFETGLQEFLSLDEIFQVARDAGLEKARFDPICMGVKRKPFAGRSRQIYFVLFEAPQVESFRSQIERLSKARGGMFHAGVLDLVLLIGGSDAGFASWFPITVDRVTECQAPLAEG